jgi:hypothetical protein
MQQPIAPSRLLVASLLTGLAGACSSSTGPGRQVNRGDSVDVTDAGPAADSACQPTAVVDFEPAQYVSADAGSSACSAYVGDAGLVQAYGEACIDHTSTFAACSAFAPPPAAADCMHCLVSVESADASAYGAVVVATIPMINYAGCVAALDPTPQGASCAQAIYAAAACAEFACKQSCPVFDDQSTQAFRTCWNAAWSTVCAGYGASADACLADERSDGGTIVARTCFSGPYVEDDYLSIAHLLCGS